MFKSTNSELQNLKSLSYQSLSNRFQDLEIIRNKTEKNIASLVKRVDQKIDKLENELNELKSKKNEKYVLGGFHEYEELSEGFGIDPTSLIALLLLLSPLIYISIIDDPGYLILFFIFIAWKKFTYSKNRIENEKNRDLALKREKEFEQRNGKFLKTINSKIEKLENKIDEENNNLNEQISKHRKILNDLESVFEEKEKLMRRAKERERTAKIAAFDNNARVGSQTIKTDLLKKVKDRKKCVYCNEMTPKKDLVLDHIHPVAKGGLSTPQNSILVCSSCNSKKRDLTLRAYCKKYKKDFENISSALERQGKDV